MKRCQASVNRLPFWHVTRPVARDGLVVEHLTQLAAVAARNLSVNAHEEVLTVVGVGVARMRRGFELVDLLAGELENIWRGEADTNLLSRDR